MYSNIIKDRMDEVKLKSRAKAKPKPGPVHAGQKRKRGGATAHRNQAVIVPDDGEQPPETVAFQQPALVTGTTLKPYQLEGVAWMVSLFEHGVSGILGAVIFHSQTMV